MKKMTYSLLMLLLTLSFNMFAQDNAQVFKQLEVSYRPDFAIKDLKSWQRSIEKFSTTQKADGTWSDVDYSAVNSMDFAPKTHLSRTAMLAEAYGTPGQPYNNQKDLLPKIRKALDHWIAKNYKSYNWWHNEIGVQQYILRTLILTKGDLGQETLNKTLPILRRTVIDQTGQNRMWRSEIVFARSLLIGDNSKAAEAADEVKKMLVFDKGEGILSDGSFQQHGPMIYNGGYGDKFIEMMAKFMTVVDGTQYSFSKSSRQILIDFVLDSQLWLTRYNKYDYGVIGRSLTIKNRNAINLGSGCLILSRMDTKEKKALEKCAQGILNNTVSGVVGNKAYYRSDFAVQHENEYYASVKMYSRRTLNNDAPSNGEGLMSHHLSDGAMLLLKDGSEYENIFPVWDWNKIPGTTVEQKKIIPAQYIPGRSDLFDHIRFFGQSSFVGSVSNSRYGASSFNFQSNPKYDNLKVKKAWFFFDQAIVALGAGINCPGCEEVQTTLNQTLSKGEVKLFSDDRSVSLLQESVENFGLFAILHQNVGYVFPSQQSVNVSNKIRKGDWSKINSSYKPEVASAKVFIATLGHGSNPVNEKYEYIILPETTEKALKAYNVQNNFEIVNNEKVQAVLGLKQNLVQAAFFQKGGVSLGDYTIDVSAPCLIMIESREGQLSITAADPTQKLISTMIVVNGKPYFAQFGQGSKAGASVIAK